MIDTILKIYFFIFFGLILVSSIIKVALKLSGKYQAVPNNVQWDEALVLPFTLLGGVGVFGSLYETPIFSPMFWKAYVAISLLQTLFFFLSPKMRLLKNKLSEKQFVVMCSVSLIAGLPFFYVLVDYAFWNFPA